MWGRNVGQALGLRRPLRPPRARPTEILGRGNQACGDGIVFYISNDLPELRRGANQVVEALILPKWLSGARKKQVGLLGCCSFVRSKQAGQFHQRSDEQMHVVWHDDPRVQFIMPSLGSVANGNEDEFRNGGNSKEGWSKASLVEQVIHGKKRFTGGQIRGRENSIWRQAV